MNLNKSWRCLLFCLIVAAPAVAQVSVSLPDTVAAAGDSLCVPVIIGDITGPNVTAFEFTVTFDPLIVNAVTPYYQTTGGLTAGWTVLETHNNTTGSIHVGGFSTTPLSGSGMLLCLRFHILPAAANGAMSALTFSGFAFNEGSPPANLTNGSVTVQNPSLPDISISLPDTSAVVATQICVPVFVGDVTDREITAFEFTVAFDPLLINAVAPYYSLAGGLAAGWTVLETHNNGTGTIHIGGFGTASLSDQGQLLCLYFQVLITAPDGAVSPLSFSQFTFNEGDPAAQTTDGSITISCPEPEQVTGVVASDNRCTDVMITWTDLTSEDGYDVRRNGVSLGSTLGNTTSFYDVTASPGNVYAYTVVAYNICGSGPESLPDSGKRMTVPAQVTGLTASDNRCMDVLLSWNDVAGEDSFQIRRNDIRIGMTTANVTTYTDTTALPGVVYAYTVAAYNVCGQGLASSSDNGMRRSVPAQVLGVAASDSLYCGYVAISWSDVSDETEYRIKRNGEFLISISAPATSYQDFSATPWTRYSYKVTAYNECGYGTESVLDSGSSKSVPQGTFVTASNEYCDSIKVCWPPVPHATGYRLLRNEAVLAVLPSSVTCISELTVAPGIVYFYSIVPFNECGDGPASPVDGGSRRTIPGALGGFTTSDSSCDAVYFTWSFVPGNITGFRFFRNDTLINTIPVDSTSYRDIPPAGTYTYSMCAYNECGNGPLSTDQGTRLTAPPVVINVNATDNLCDGVVIAWNDVAGEDSFQIRRNGARIGRTAANVLTFTDATAGHGTYMYRVVAYNICGAGDSSGSDSGTRLQPLPVVPNVQATDASCANITITWNDIAGEDSFQIRRNGARIAAVNSNVTTFVDSPSAGVYLYRVVAYSPCGAGDSSGSDAGTRLSPPVAAAPIATDQRCDSIIVTWIDLVNEDSFFVQRNHVTIAALGANVSRYADNPAAGAYLYTVYGWNACGNGAAASDSGHKLLTPGIPDSVRATDNLCAQIVVTWRAPAGDLDNYVVLRDDFVIEAVPFGTNVFVDNITGHHAYRVFAHSNVCGDGNSSASDSGWGHIAAEVPFGITASDTLCDRIELSWRHAWGEVEDYLIYRDGTLRDSVADTTYTDHPDNWFPHEYRVAARNSFCGEGELTLPTSGSERLITYPLTDVPDTVMCLDTVTASFNHCAGVEADSIFISLDNGNYQYLTVFAPVQDEIHIVVPYVHALVTSHCRFLVKAVRGARVDSLISNEFTVLCFDAADEQPNSAIPDDFFLDRNYPNPFNPSTTIRFGVPKVVSVTMEIYDVLGRKIVTLVSGVMQPGVHTVTWNCEICPTGMYLVRMTAENRVFLHKMLLLK